MKKIFKNMSMSKKLMLAPTVVFIFLIALSYVSYTGLSNQKMAIEDIVNNRFKAYQRSSEIAKSIANVHANLYKIISWTGANRDADIIQALSDEQKAQIKGNIEPIQNILKFKMSTGKEKKLLQASLEQLIEYQKQALAVCDVVKTDVSMATMFMGTADEKYNTLNQTLRELLVFEEMLSEERYNFSLKSFNSVLTAFVILLVTAIVISVLSSLFMSRLITQPVKQTMDVIKNVADGDLTQDIEVDSRDEIGELAEAINTMRVKMGEAVGQSVAISHTLSESASEQAASLEETSASLDETASMTRQNAGNTTEANNLMALAMETTEKANISMADLTKSMKEIAGASEQAQKIVKSIDEIAFQTNLLALNAAVEAARAGEAGAGFAVVADEVRNLALRATEAAKGTSGLIEDIVKKVRNGEGLVSLTNDAFSQVTTNSTKVVELMGEVAAASQEQAQGIDQINKAVAQMSTVTQRNAASSEELASIMSMFKTENHRGKITPEKLHPQKSSRKKMIFSSPGGEVTPGNFMSLKEPEFV